MVHTEKNQTVEQRYEAAVADFRKASWLKGRITTKKAEMKSLSFKISKTKNPAVLYDLEQKEKRLIEELKEIRQQLSDYLDKIGR